MQIPAPIDPHNSGYAPLTHTPVHGALVLDDKLSIMRGRVHELTGQGRDVLALALCACSSGTLVWIGTRREVDALAPTGLREFVDPSRFILVVGSHRREILWAAEQALRTRGVACVTFQLSEGPDLTESRRLQIAAESSGATGLILLSGQAQVSAAQTRWQCEPVCDGQTEWVWRCEKNKRGRLGRWKVRRQGGANGWSPKAGFVHLDAAPSA